MVINLRRIAAAAGVVILLAVIYLIGVSFLQAGEEKKDAKTEVEAEQPLMEKKEPKVKYTRGFFAEYRMERERVRGEQVELLREMLNNPNVDEKSRAAAAAHLVQISEALEQEIKTEALIIARGFQDCVVIIQPPVYGGRSTGPDFQLTSGPGRGVEESGVAHGRMSSRECSVIVHHG